MSETEPRHDGLLLLVDYCLTPTHRINNAAIVIRDGKILAVGGASAFQHLQGYRAIAFDSCYALPGFVDTHIYGANGFDCMRAHEDANIGRMSSKLAEHGVSAFLPTTQSADPERLIAVISALSQMCELALPGALPVGIHVEGPFISSLKRGAHQHKYIRPIDLAEAESMIAAGRGRVRIFTFAPELDGALDLVQLLCRHEISPAMGHTAADQEPVLEAINAGARRCSHLYNGMEPLRQRKVGLAALAMTDGRLWVEIIPDGVHIHPGMIDLACRCIDKSKLISISNGTEAAGLPDGEYMLGDDTIHVEKGKSMLADGTIAGAVKFLDENYRNLLQFSHLDETEVAACFTLNAARSVGLADRGEIKPGRRADIVVLGSDHQVRMTMVGGQIVHQVAAATSSVTGNRELS